VRVRNEAPRLTTANIDRQIQRRDLQAAVVMKHLSNFVADAASVRTIEFVAKQSE
jgi:hypothetical protein